MKRTPDEVARIVEEFLDGTGGKWDWDDFCSIKIDGQELDHIRVLCSNASVAYPPTEKGHYCSAQGRDYLREITRELLQQVKLIYRGILNGRTVAKS